MAKLNWGLVGLGGLAEQLAPAFKESRNGQLIACASRTFESAQDFARRHGVDRAYPSYEELVRDPRVEAVYVATPNHLHTPVVLAAAAAGKQVFCEKPMAPTVLEAEEMISACRKAGVSLRLGFYLRFLQLVQAARAQVLEGRIGEVQELLIQRYSDFRFHATAPWRRDLSLAHAGVLADVGVHLLDLTQLIVGDHIARVFALAYPPRSSGQPDERVTILLEFGGGCQATVRCSRGLPAGANDLVIIGNRGTLCTGPLRWTDSYSLSLRADGQQEDRQFPVEDLYRLEIEAFADDLIGASTPLATGEDGLRMVHVTEAAIRSLETGAAVPVEY